MLLKFIKTKRPVPKNGTGLLAQIYLALWPQIIIQKLRRLLLLLQQRRQPEQRSLRS
ncbi:hypothetical protein AGR1A_Cc50245 [Agrobacterium fabacearum CFBP 5771]|nr:hypothetical protein AGR1A_Cc50245 [Agrobacterium fabacearum CFBP 5771]